MESPWSCFRELEITRTVAVAVAVAVAAKTGGWHERGFFVVKEFEYGRGVRFGFRKMEITLTSSFS